MPLPCVQLAVVSTEVRAMRDNIPVVAIELKDRGQVKHIAVLGREMVAFRSDDDEEKVYVLDAFCVHMGANLAFGGRVMPGSRFIEWTR